ncbi:nitroreductase family protein [Chitinasiproducens palmae]|nr:nitroreductase [Chitinasiproducens palmae]
MSSETSANPRRAALDVLLSRQSRWPLVDPAPRDEDLDVIFDCALRAPDHGRLRPWRFVVVRGDARAELGEVMVELACQREPATPREEQAWRRERAFAAPVIVVLGASVEARPGIPATEQLLSVAAAAMNMLNAAHALGYGAFWVTGPDTYDRDLHAALDFEPDEQVVGFLLIGSTAQPAEPVERPRRDAHVREWLGRASF